MVLWKAAVEIVRGIHNRGVAIMDIKPDHLILSSRGLYIVDYGCSYFVANGRPIAFLLMSPIFSSVRDSTHFSNPVSNYLFFIISVQCFKSFFRALLQTGNHSFLVSCM